MNRITTIDLIRHGEPLGGERFRGWQDDPLSREGWRQMHAALNKTYPWQAIITSPLRRCQEFAIALGREKGIPVKQNGHLKEMSFGDWEGKTVSEIKALQKDNPLTLWKTPENLAPPNGENLMAFQARVLKAWDAILSEYSGKHLLVVAHGGTIRMILAHILDMPLNSLFKIQVPYACCSRIRLFKDQDGTQLSHLVCHGHLHDPKYPLPPSQSK